MKNNTFVGRKLESHSLTEWDTTQSKLTVIHGRRRVGKSRLIEENFSGQQVYRVEGIENKNSAYQQKHFLETLAVRFTRPALLNLESNSWKSLLILLSETLGTKPTVVVFDEFQWLANNQQGLISELKYVWDNYFLKNNRVHLILCGSVSSFMVKKVVRSNALFGRIGQVIELQPLSFQESWKGFFPKYDLIEALGLYLTLGGIPKYLELCDPNKSALQNIQKLCLQSNSALIHEIEAIFVSSLGKNPNYLNITKVLATAGAKTRIELAQTLGLSASGGLSQLLEDLCLAGIIEEYSRLNSPSPETAKLKKYRIKDNFISFYFKFIRPNLKKVLNNTYSKISEILKEDQFNAWLGIMFERLCLQNEELIAKALGFLAVEYQVGRYFHRADKTSKQKGLDIDLIFIRKDRKINICEVKFGNNLNRQITSEINQKIEKFPNPKGYKIMPVLISARPIKKDSFGDIEILTATDIFKN